MTFTLSGMVVKADWSSDFAEAPGKVGRKVVIYGTKDGEAFEVVLHIPKNSGFDPLGTSGLGDQVALEVTM